jgi:hypothetical protein
VAANLIVRDSADEARRALARSSCALASARGVPPAEAASHAREGRSLFAQSRAFKQELVDRGIDARDAGAAIREIDEALARCG